MAERVPSLELTDVVSGYGKKRILTDVTMSVAHGEIAVLVGQNGAGKSTLLKTVFGLVPLWSGHVCINGLPVHDASPAALLRAGVAYVPQGGRVFPDLSVLENLVAANGTMSSATVKDRTRQVLELFPQLRSRLRDEARTLSGGEKQMVGLAMALMKAPKLLLLDEPTMGLSPVLTRELLEFVRRLCASTGGAVLMVEQRVHEVLRVASRAYVLRNGKIVFSGRADHLHDDETLLATYF